MGKLDIKKKLIELPANELKYHISTIPESAYWLKESNGLVYVSQPQDEDPTDGHGVWTGAVGRVHWRRIQGCSVVCLASAEHNEESIQVGQN